MEYGFSLIQHLDKYYDTADLAVKQKMIGSIFPEKLVFEDKTYRTANPNALLFIITLNINELGSIKKDFPEIVSEKSCFVDPCFEHL